MITNRIHHAAARLIGVVAALGGVLGVLTLADAVSIPMLALVLMLVSGATVLAAVLSKPLWEGRRAGFVNRIADGSLIWLALATNLTALWSLTAYLTLTLVAALCLVTRIALHSRIERDSSILAQLNSTRSVAIMK
ncbi:MAG: hypothetical protein U5O16_14465 [Rhodococcus sp. (in: high G+C Gram-positive bacteria)]|uniref:hypothetical protein n=1 Tax=Rhodococcus sp. TaxID=1831 RepID=UPI002AD96647|nr:hypothetical protein [Rhodococcus sp. (in: high G+C Gram-positive bacteria)]